MNQKPDYSVGAMDRMSQVRTTVGVAWQKENGQISIRLNPFVVINGGPETILTLFPLDNRNEEA